MHDPLVDVCLSEDTRVGCSISVRMWYAVKVLFVARLPVGSRPSDMLRPTRLQMPALNTHLTCILCGGYFIDATTIIECLHSFCRACIVRYLESSRYCPVCDVQIHKTRPLLNIRPDNTLQNIVYKLVPGLFQDEMKKRKEFYSSQPDGGLKSARSPEDRGEAVEHRIIYTPDENISLSLEYGTGSSEAAGEQQSTAVPETEQTSESNRRFLQCPGAITIGHLKKFIRMKYDLPLKYVVDILCMEESLLDSYTLMDVAYIYSWRRKGPLRLFYRFLDRPSKRQKTSHHSCDLPKPSEDKSPEAPPAPPPQPTEEATEVIPLKSPTSEEQASAEKIDVDPIPETESIAETVTPTKCDNSEKSVESEVTTSDPQAVLEDPPETQCPDVNKACDEQKKSQEASPSEESSVAVDTPSVEVEAPTGDTDIVSTIAETPETPVVDKDSVVATEDSGTVNGHAEGDVDKQPTEKAEDPVSNLDPNTKIDDVPSLVESLPKPGKDHAEDEADATDDGEVDSGRGSEISSRTEAQSVCDDDIGSPASSVLTPDIEKTPVSISSPQPIPSPGVEEPLPERTAPAAREEPDHPRDDIGALDLSTSHRKSCHDRPSSTRTRHVANPPVLDKHRVTPCLTIPKHPSFKLLPTVVTPPHTSLYKKPDYSRNFRCRGSTLTVINPDPNSYRPKIVIKNLDPRPDHGHSRHHHHHHHRM